MRHPLIGLLAAALFVSSVGVSPAEGAHAPGAPPAGSLDALCSPRLQVADPQACSSLGPGAYAAAMLALGLTSPLPVLPTAPLELPDPLIQFEYARVVTPGASVFPPPADAAIAEPPARTFSPGFVFVSLNGTNARQTAGALRINPGEYMRPEDLRPVEPSRFQGLSFTQTPSRPFAWVLKPFRPRREPGGAEDPSMPHLRRYAVVQIFDTRRVGQWDWYLIGPDRWIEQRFVAKVDPQRDPPPPSRGQWITVNLYEQSLAAYEDGQLVYATLVASGLNRWPTRPGVFQIYHKLALDHMSGAFESDKSDYYSLEDVPWVMYFDGERALHGAYWHDGFGYKRSHGCVNLSPADARWLFDWAAEGTTVHVFDSGNG